MPDPMVPLKSLNGHPIRDAAVWPVISPGYSENTAYPLNSHVLVNNVLYRNIHPIGSEGEVWTAGHWAATTVDEELRLGIQNGIDALHVLATEYDPTHSYLVDNYVMKDGTFYRCITEIQNGEEWNPLHWAEVTVANELGDHRIKLNTLGDIVVLEYDAEQSYPRNSYVRKDGIMYRSLVDVAGLESWDLSKWEPCTVGSELSKIPGVTNLLSIEKGGTGASTPEGAREAIGAQEKLGFNVSEELNKRIKSVNKTLPDENGNVQIVRVPMADNFTSDESRLVSGTFIERTTGGDTSITDGNAYLGVLYGNSVRTGYTAENRGTIINATPETFNSANWNLYDNETGYARVLKYSDVYGFKIGGTYTGISFSATIDGEKTAITPDSDGLFTIPSDGYVFVTGGNDTDTYVLMTWSDWEDGYTGDFLTKNVSTIDFSEVMQNVFPFGLCAIGIVTDEINFNDRVATVRIERVAYSAENLTTAENSGRAFVYDTNWIYSVKETPETVRFAVDNDLVVYDHGVEYFTGTEVPLTAFELFGQNLKEKLRREVVAVTPQNFSASQKQIARANIEAAWNSEVIKSINNKVPDANGNITIVEGQSNASYGSYRIDTVIPPAAWSLVNGQYQVSYSDPLIKSTMTGSETWLDNNDAMLGKTTFNTIDGALLIVTAVQPTETWQLHVLLAENGATVLEDVNNKVDESDLAIVENDDTAFHNIAAGKYVMWKGEVYKATAAISSGDTLSSTGSEANLAAVSGGIANELNAGIGSLVVDLIYPVGSIYMSVASASPATLFGGTWEQLKDRFLLGAGDSYTAGDTGGSASHTLTTDEMPSHNHTFTGSAVTSSDISANHTHTGTSGNPSANHHHSGPNHAHSFYWYSFQVQSGSGAYPHCPAGVDTSLSSVSTAYAGTGATGNVSAWHTHTTTTGNQSSGHTHSVTAEGSIGNTGSGTAFSIMNPYLVVYMWKRTA